MIVAPPRPCSEEVGMQPEVCGQGHRKSGKNETFLVWLLSSKLVLFFSFFLAKFCIFRVLVSPVSLPHWFYYLMSREYCLMIILNTPTSNHNCFMYNMKYSRTRKQLWVNDRMFTSRNTGALPIATGGEATLDRNWGSTRRLLQRTPRGLTNSAAGRKTDLSNTNKIHKERYSLPAPRYPLDCPLPLGFDSSKKAKPPAEPKEVLWPWGSACSQNPTRACGREDSLCCTARIYRGPSVGSTNCGSKMKYFWKCHIVADVY